VFQVARGRSNIVESLVLLHSSFVHFSEREAGGRLQVRCAVGNIQADMRRAFTRVLVIVTFNPCPQ